MGAELNALTPESVQCVVGPMWVPNKANGKDMAQPSTTVQRKTKRYRMTGSPLNTANTRNRNSRRVDGMATAYAVAIVVATVWQFGIDPTTKATSC